MYSIGVREIVTVFEIAANGALRGSGDAVAGPHCRCRGCGGESCDCGGTGRRGDHAKFILVFSWCNLTERRKKRRGGIFYIPL